MVVLEPKAEGEESMKRKDNAVTPRPGRGGRRALRYAEGPRRRLHARRKLALTTPDLVLLSLLAERPMHGGLIRASETDEPAAGPERSTYQTTAKGRVALADALERKEWTTQRERPPFLAWIALSWQARPGVFQSQLERRCKFLEKELLCEKETLRSILEEVGHPHHEAVWMVSLMIEQFQVELRWLKKLQRELKHRAPANRPDYAQG